MQKKWHWKEFRAQIDGLGFGISTEKVSQEACDFMDNENLTPADVNIETHIEFDQMNSVQILVTQIFYRK